MRNFVDFALGLRHGSKQIMERDGTATPILLMDFLFFRPVPCLILIHDTVYGIQWL